MTVTWRYRVATSRVLIRLSLLSFSQTQKQDVAEYENPLKKPAPNQFLRCKCYKVYLQSAAVTTMPCLSFYVEMAGFFQTGISVLVKQQNRGREAIALS